MPQKTKYTKEMILRSGYLLAQKSGIESVNSRSIAGELHCSTQPIFWHYPTMEELRMAVFEYACEQFEQQVLADACEADFLKKSYLKVISLARHETNLFRLIYMSKYCQNQDLYSVRISYQSNQLIYQEIKQRFPLSDEACKDVLIRMSIFIQGIASFIATSNIFLPDETVVQMAEKTLIDFVQGYKETEL